MLRAIVAGETPLDIFVFEGTVIQAPNGTGQWNRFAGRHPVEPAIIEDPSRE